MNSFVFSSSKSEQIDEVDEFLVKNFIAINEDAKSWMNVTPRHFLTFAKTYHHINASKERFFVDNESKLKVIYLKRSTHSKNIRNHILLMLHDFATNISLLHRL